MDISRATGMLARASAIITRILAALLLLLLLLYGALYWFLLRDPQELAQETLAGLSARTGLQFSFGSVDVILLPLPELSISDVSVKGADLEFTTAWVAARPNLPRLLLGEVLPGRITLLRPRLWMRLGFPLTDKDAWTTALDGRKGANGPNAWLKTLFDAGMRLDCQQGSAAFAGSEDTALDLSSINCRLYLSSRWTVEGFAEMAAARFSEGSRNLAALEGVNTSGSARIEDFWNSASDINARGRFRLAGLVDNSSFSLDYRSRAASHWLAWDLRADLRLDSMPVPAAFSGKAAAVAGGPIVIREGAWMLGADSGALEGEINDASQPANANIRCLFTARRLSLSQWFGFARNLAPGLQLSLDNILNVRAALDISTKAINAPRLEATCAGSRFTGEGSVADLANPVVYLDLKTDYADLGLGLEESLIRSPLEPWFGHATLTPMPGEPLKPGETGIGYDIRLAAERLRYGPTIIDNAALRIYPGAIDKDGLEEVQLAATAGFYGGKFTGSCVLGAPADMPLAIKAKASGVNGARLARDLPALPFQKGTLEGSANVTSRGKELARFMANLRGQVDVSAANPRIGGASFTKAQAQIALRSASAGKTSAGFDGKWKVSIADQAFAADMALDGSVSFNNDGASFKNLPASLKLRLLEALGPLPAQTAAEASGALSGGTASQKFTLAQGSLSMLGQKASISASIDAAKAQASGKFSAPAMNLDKLLQGLGLSFRMPAHFRQLAASADYSATSSKVAVNGLKATLGKLPVRGKLDWQKKDSLIKFSLETDKIDLDSLLAARTSKNTRAIDFSYLKPLNLDGEIRVGRISGWKLVAESLRLPLRLASGKLKFGPGQARFYGSPLALAGNLDFAQGLGIASSASISSFDLGAAAKALQVKGVLLGKASASLDLNAAITRWDQLPGRLNGTFNASMASGSWQSLDSKGKPKKATVITSASASGKIENGVLRSNDLKMRGPDLSVAGGGSVNLESKKLDYKFEVDMKGVPDFPLTLTGTLNSPKTSIGAGKMVLNAIGGIASGIGDAVSSIAKGFMKIFK